MKNLLVLLACLTITTNTFSQFNKNWEFNYNGVGDLTDRIRDMVIDNAGNIYMTGYSYERSNQKDLYIAKYSSTGDLIWEDIYQNPSGANDDGEAIIIDNNGDIVVAGESNRDYITLKYSPSGSQLWVKTYDGVGLDKDAVADLVADSNNNIYITGRSEQAAGNDEITTVKYNSNGDQLWVKTFASSGDGNDRVYQMTIDGNDNIYIAGRYFNGNDFDGVLLNYNTSGTLVWSKTITSSGDDRFAVLYHDGTDIYACGREFNGNDDDFYLQKYTSSGMLLWTKTEDNGDDDRIEAMVATNNEVWLAGRSRNASNYFDMVVVKYDSNGAKIAETPYAIGAESRPRDIVLVGSDVYVGGRHEINLEDDLFLVKYDNNGAQQWVKSYNDTGVGRDEVQTMASTPTGKILVTGRSYSSTSQSNGLIREYNTDGTLSFAKSIEGRGDNRDVINDMTLDAQGNVITVGYTFKIENEKNLLIIKQDAAGNMMWLDTLSSLLDGRDEGVAVETDGANNVYMTGFLNNDIITVKYSPLGSLTWGRIFDGAATGQDRPSDLLVNSSNEIYVLGESDVISGAPDDNDVVLLKYQTDGTLLWSKYIANSGDDEAYEMAFDASENIYIASKIANSLTTSEATVYKFDPSGNQLWARSMGGNGEDRFREIVTTSNSVIVAGRILNTDENAVIASYDLSGNLIYSNSIDLGAEEYANDLQTTDTETILSVNSATTAGRSNQLIKYNNSGTELWSTTQNNNTIDDLNTLAIDETNSILYGGGEYLDATDKHLYLKAIDWMTGNEYKTTSFTGGTYGDDEAIELILNSSNDIIVAASASYDLAQEDFTTLEYSYQKPVANEDLALDDIQLYPTLLEKNEHLFVNGIEPGSQYHFFVYESSGKLVAQFNNLTENTIPISKTNLAAGVYIYELKWKDRSKAGQFIMK